MADGGGAPATFDHTGRSRSGASAVVAMEQRARQLESRIRQLKSQLSGRPWDSQRINSPRRAASYSVMSGSPRESPRRASSPAHSQTLRTHPAIRVPGQRVATGSPYRAPSVPGSRDHSRERGWWSGPFAPPASGDADGSSTFGSSPRRLPPPPRQHELIPVAPSPISQSALATRRPPSSGASQQAQQQQPCNGDVVAGVRRLLQVLGVGDVRGWLPHLLGALAADYGAESTEREVWGWLASRGHEIPASVREVRSAPVGRRGAWEDVRCALVAEHGSLRGAFANMSIPRRSGPRLAGPLEISKGLWNVAMDHRAEDLVDALFGAAIDGYIGYDRFEWVINSGITASVAEPAEPAEPAEAAQADGGAQDAVPREERRDPAPVYARPPAAAVAPPHVYAAPAPAAPEPPPGVHLEGEDEEELERSDGCNGAPDAEALAAEAEPAPAPSVSPIPRDLAHEYSQPSVQTRQTQEWTLNGPDGDLGADLDEIHSEGDVHNRSLEEMRSAVTSPQRVVRSAPPRGCGGHTVEAADGAPDSGMMEQADSDASHPDADPGAAPGEPPAFQQEAAPPSETSRTGLQSRQGSQVSMGSSRRPSQSGRESGRSPSRRESFKGPRPEPDGPRRNSLQGVDRRGSAASLRSAPSGAARSTASEGRRGSLGSQGSPATAPSPQRRGPGRSARGTAPPPAASASPPAPTQEQSPTSSAPRATEQPEAPRSAPPRRESVKSTSVRGASSDEAAPPQQVPASGDSTTGPAAHEHHAPARTSEPPRVASGRRRSLPREPIRYVGATGKDITVSASSSRKSSLAGPDADS
eukprot:TRINITY_DN11091_c1_g1_i1.p1 TRINITY_DN11091_c1_g1~~TRINITY_DN11091_c1_g1_i1.p1  ORF type:complete len:842 (+),score=123.35 TRINITY_DN11091_c1_g1_i1:93-2528(+)